MPFNGIHNLRAANESVKLEMWQLQEIERCTKDPIYFIRHYVYINTKDEGTQLMKTYPFQDEAIRRFLKYRFNINRWSRQVGKSTIVRAFILWYAMFHEDQLIAMLANKLMLAKEQLQLLRESYLNLPFWLQPGVKLWNKMSIQFANGCRIIIAASSSDGIRGFSPNLLYLDEFAFLRPGMADEFMASVFPTISSGKKTRVIITSTPSGMNHFYRMWEDAVDEATATAHDLQAKYVRSTVLWNEVPGRDEQWGLDEKLRCGEERFRQEYECEFIGSAVTLIDYRTLQHLHPDKPMAHPRIPDDYQLRIYGRPLNPQQMEMDESVYIAALDTGYGMRQDYHVLQILYAKSSTKLEQVLTLSSNSVTVEDFCAVSFALLRKYHFPALTIEYNGGSGALAYQTMTAALQYPNMVDYDSYFRGMYSTTTTKSQAVMLLKTYIQKNYLLIHDEKTINELMSFTRPTKNTWGASGGNHDDHVTSLYWAVYHAYSPYFQGKMEEISWDDVVRTVFAPAAEIADMRNVAEQVRNPQIVQEQRGIAELAGNQRMLPQVQPQPVRATVYDGVPQQYQYGPPQGYQPNMQQPNMQQPYMQQPNMAQNMQRPNMQQPYMQQPNMQQTYSAMPPYGAAQNPYGDMRLSAPATKKKKKKWPIILGICVAVIAIVIAIVFIIRSNGDDNNEKTTESTRRTTEERTTEERTTEEPTTETPPPTAESGTRTIMVYMVGSNLESDYCCATEDISEMVAAENDPNVQIILYTGGANKWYTPEISNNGNTYLLADDNELTCLKTEESKNMGDSATLTNFLQYCADNYPAEQFSLILWNHGGGPLIGYGHDEITQDMLSLKELSDYHEKQCKKD